ncbi:MAG: recombinase family protein [Bacillota bacterium]|nr:recombinase family protein [Bacillota bacterium]
MRCAIYRRVSTDMQVEEGVSLDNQLHRLKAFAESQGWTIVIEYADEGISAKDIEHRPGIQQMLDDVEQKKFDVLLVYKLDRLVRRVRDLHEILQHLEKYEVMFKSATEPFDTTTPAGKLFITMIAAMAEWERETIAERVYDNLKHRAESGKRNGGPSPFGYDYNQNGELIINQEEAKWIQFIFNKYKTNGSQNIAKMLNKYGVKTKKGAIWSDFAVRFVLGNPIYCGKNRWNKRTPIKGRNEIINDLDQKNFKSIIPLEVFEEIQLLIKQRSSQAFRSDNHYPFSGIAKCSCCGNRLTGAFKKRKSGGVYRFYKCAGRFAFGICNLPTIAEESIDQAFIEMLDLAKTDLELGDDHEPLGISLQELDKQLNRIKERKERLKELYIDGDISKDDYKKRLDRISQEEDELQKLGNVKDQVASIEEIKSILQNVKDEWHHMSFESRKHAIHSLFESLTIEIVQDAKPGKFPLPAVINIKEYSFK